MNTFIMQLCFIADEDFFVCVCVCVCVWSYVYVCFSFSSAFSFVTCVHTYIHTHVLGSTLVSLVRVPPEAAHFFL